MTFCRSLSRLVTLLSLGLLSVQPFVALAQTPNDRNYGELWYLPQIDAPAAWETSTGSSQVVVAVLDTGVDLDHPDLVQNIWLNTGEVAENGKDDDGNGFIDDVHGWDFIDDDADPSPDAEGDSTAVSHGTLIAGIIGAEGNNQIGVTGLAWNVSVMPVRMLDGQGSGSSVVAARAVDYAVANGADVINLSFAGSVVDSGFRRAIEDAYDAGVVVVSAMGNEGRNTDAEFVYPACLKGDVVDWVIGVASSTIADEGSEFSNFGSKCTDISAPGEDIYGLSYHNLGAGYDELYDGMWSGTSMATPVVSGAVALLLSAFPNLSVEDVSNALKLSVDPMVLSRTYRGKFGAGRLNVAQAMSVAAQYAALRGEEAADAGEVVPQIPEEAAAQLAFGSTSGRQPMVDLRTGDGTQLLQFLAYASTFTGGIRVAQGDVDGDGDADVVTGVGNGGGPHVRAFTSQGALIGEFFPYSAASRSGVEVAVGDIDGDGVDEIVSSVGSGVSRDVIASSYLGVEKVRFTASVFGENDALRVSTGDIDGDGKHEFIVASGKGAAPKVAVYDHNGTYLLEFSPYAATFTGGVYVASGDIDGNGVDEIITGTGDGGGPHVRIFTEIGAVVGSFFAYDETTRHGVRVAVTDTDRDGIDEIIASPGPGMAEVRVFSPSGSILSRWTAPVGGGEGTAVAAW